MVGMGVGMVTMAVAITMVMVVGVVVTRAVAVAPLTLLPARHSWMAVIRLGWGRGWGTVGLKGACGLDGSRTGSRGDLSR